MDKVAAKAQKSTSWASLPPNTMIKTVAITQLKPNPKNPRIIKDFKFKKLVQSIKDFPEMLKVRPIVVNSEMVILGGNMRWRAVQEAGYKELDVDVVDWPVEKQNEFVIKDNASGGEWDWNALANEWDTAQINSWGLETPGWADPDKVDEINNNNEWVGMPEYGLNDQSKKLIIQFDTDAERDEFVDKVKLKINKKLSSAWTTWYPERGTNDISSLKYEE